MASTTQYLRHRSLQLLSLNSRPSKHLLPFASIHPDQTIKALGIRKKSGPPPAKSKASNNAPKKKKARNTYINHDLKDMQQFTLCDAMRYVHISIAIGASRILLPSI
jgi:hypothetical protein